MTSARVFAAIALMVALGACGDSDTSGLPIPRTGGLSDERPPGEVVAPQPGTGPAPQSEVADDASGPANSAEPGRADDRAAPHPREGEYRYRSSPDTERSYVVESISAEGDAWRVRINDGGKLQTQLWTPRDTTMVSEKWGRETCEFAPPLLLRPTLHASSGWTAETEGRLGGSDSYLSRTVRGRVTGETTVSVMGQTLTGWRVEESIRTVIEGRPPPGMSVVTTQRHETVDEVTQTSVFSQDLGIALTIDGHRRFTNWDGSVHEGDFRYELIGGP